MLQVDFREEEKTDRQSGTLLILFYGSPVWRLQYKIYYPNLKFQKKVDTVQFPHWKLANGNT